MIGFTTMGNCCVWAARRSVSLFGISNPKSSSNMLFLHCYYLLVPPTTPVRENIHTSYLAKAILTLKFTCLSWCDARKISMSSCTCNDRTKCSSSSQKKWHSLVECSLVAVVRPARVVSWKEKEHKREARWRLQK
jgi:hypothetical protein